MRVWMREMMNRVTYIGLVSVILIDMMISAKNMYKHILLMLLKLLPKTVSYCPGRAG